MQGRSHLAIGVSTYLALAMRGLGGFSLPDLGFAAAEWSLTVSAAVVGFSSLLPDVDQRQALLSRQTAARPMSEVVSRVMRHRGATHSLVAMLALSLASAGLGATWGLPGLAALMVWGYLLHLLADMITKSGVPLLWPLPRRFGLVPMRIATGSLAERLLVAAIVVASAGHVVWPMIQPNLA